MFQLRGVNKLENDILVALITKTKFWANDKESFISIHKVC